VPAQVLNALAAVILLTSSAIESPFRRHKLRVRRSQSFRRRKKKTKNGKHNTLRSFANKRATFGSRESCQIQDCVPQIRALSLLHSFPYQHALSISRRTNSSARTTLLHRRLDAAKQCCHPERATKRRLFFCFEHLALPSSLFLFLYVSFSPAGKEGSRLNFSVEN